MKPALSAAWLWLVVLVFCSEPTVAQIVLETQNLRLELEADGRLRSLTGRHSGLEYAWTGEPLPIASVYRGGAMELGSQEAYYEHEPPPYRRGECFPATSVSLTGDLLKIQFAQAKVAARFRVTSNPSYLAFRLESLAGEPIDRIDLVQLRLKRLPYLGRWINVAYDDEFGVCLCAGNIRTDAAMSPASTAPYVDMRAVATTEVGFEGATAVLFGCTEPKEKFLDTMEVVERDFQMPSGARNRRSPIQNYSYLWCSPRPEDIDQYIALARRAGFRMIFFSYAAFTEGAGHFRFNARFPRGLPDLKAMTDRIRAAGLKVGLHLHYSKADRTDAYVTPVPDDRLHIARAFTLAGNVDAKSGSIPVRENPAGCTRAEGRRILKIGKELVAYGDYTTEPPYRFTGCERGHLRTGSSPHASGEGLGLLDVDDWIKFIRFDQDTDIQDESARRIAEIVNGSGPYDLVYFDGAEDVHDPFWYHVAGAQERVYRLLDPPPPVCEAAMSSHFSWHMMTRGNAYDVSGRHIKSFCREISCRSAPVRALDFTRIEFGWIFQLYRDMGPDVLEYVLSRAAAWDCPFSLRLTLAEVAAHPRAEDCLEVIKTWEDARIGGHLTAAQRAMLKTLDPSEYRYVKVWDAVFRAEWTNAWSRGSFQDKEHHLFRNEKGAYELAPIREISGLAGGRVKAYVFRRPAQPGDTFVLLWAKEGELRLSLPLASERLALMRPFGKRLEIEEENGRASFVVGSRRYLEFKGMGADETIRILRAADCSAH